MMRWALLCMSLVGVAAGAQEIGTEIAPTPPPSSGAQTDGAAPHREAPAVLKASATKHDLGIRGGFGSTGSTSVTGTSVGAPFVGGSLMVTDNFKLLLDLGLGLGLGSSSVSWALGLNAGFDLLFRSHTDALRPLLYGGVSFGLASTTRDPSVSLGVQLGAGAEYFFSPNFAVHGKIGLAVPMAVSAGSFLVGLFTISPGLGATFYL